MSHQTKYLGSNCKPVIAETVESDNQIQTHSSLKENTMTLIDTNVTAETVATSKANLDALLQTEQVIESTVEEVIKTTPESVTVKAIEPSQMNVVAKAKATASEFSWFNVGAASLLSAISVGARLAVENTLKENEEDRKSVLNIAGRVAAVATISGAAQAGIQLAIKRTNNDDTVGMLSVSGVGSVVSVVDAFFGDSVQSMFGNAIGKGKSVVDSYLNKEEAEVEAIVETAY